MIPYALNLTDKAIIAFGAICLFLFIVFFAFLFFSWLARKVGGWHILVALFGVIAFLCLCVATALWGN